MRLWSCEGPAAAGRPKMASLLRLAAECGQERLGFLPHGLSFSMKLDSDSSYNGTSISSQK